MKKVSMVLAIVLLPFFVVCQENRLWTEADRHYLVENLIRTKEELLKETQGLSEEQWKFKEAPDRWSISEVVEHINLWEMLLMYDVTRGLNAGVQPAHVMAGKGDDVVLKFILEEKSHYSLAYTKPFSYTIPMGLTDLRTNLATFLKYRNESIEYIKSAQVDLRMYARTHDRSSNLHQLYIVVFGHTDRHLRQIRNIKKHSNYPRSY